MTRGFVQSRRRASVLLIAGLLVLGLGLGSVVVRSRPTVHDITLTAGPSGTTRALVARGLVHALTAGGNRARLVETSETEDELEHVDRGVIGFALVSEAYRSPAHAHIREVAPLYVEALHFLVKAELAEAAGQSLGALRGRVVAVGPEGSAGAGLAIAVLAFAGVRPGDPATGGYVLRHLRLAEVEALIAHRDGAPLPDAVVHLATVPSKIAMRLVHERGYRLISLPFADAFRLNSLITDDGPSVVERQHVVETTIPAFTYQTEPGVPAEPLATIGARLSLVANDAVAPEAVVHVMDTVFGSQIARITHPPLDDGVLALPPRLPRHAGTLWYLRRSQPYVTSDTVSALSSSFSVLGALGGGTLFIWQWWRRRRQSMQDEVFGTYLLRIADVERRLAALELSAELTLDPLATLQREVLTIKSEALDRFAAGELGSQTVLSDLIGPLNAARDHIGELLLHVRENIEEQADAEGRTATAVWREAIKGPQGGQS